MIERDLVPNALQHPREEAPGARQFSWALFALVAGLTALAAIAYVEEIWVGGQSWTAALLAPDDDYWSGRELPEGVYRIWARTAAIPAEGDRDAFALAIEWLAQETGEDLTETLGPLVVAAEMPTGGWEDLLVDGRVPAPGTHEVLAGDFTGAAPFELDGAPFEVVGRLHPTVSGLNHAYLLPYAPALDPHFMGSDEATMGWLAPEGMKRLDELFDDGGEEGGNGAEEGWYYPELIGGATCTHPALAWSSVAALFLVFLGGAGMHHAFYRRFANPPTPLFGPAMRETVFRPKLLIATHVLLYGVFFTFMALGTAHPAIIYQLGEYVAETFADGGLSYIGDAYASGNVLDAAAATFLNNYIVQTLGLTFGVSLPPLAIGVAKTAASFAFAGFVMAPLWVGTAAGFVFHSITMVLELEAYIFASFIVLAWTLRLLRILFLDASWDALLHNLRILLGGVVFTGTMLAIAALYEAATLIWLAPVM